MRRLFFAAMALAAMSSAAAALSPDELARRTIERRAVEAVIWGMPAVNYDLMLQEMLTKTKGKVNEIVYWSRPLDWQNQTLTPNPDAIYLMTFTDTRDVGPVVIEVPLPRVDRSTATLSMCGRCPWRMPVRPAPTRARAESTSFCRRAMSGRSPKATYH